MSTLTVYSSRPESTQLACAYLGIEKLGIAVVLRPLAELATAPRPRRRLASLRAELEGITLQLLELGERLEAHQNGARQLGAGEEQELCAQRAALQARQREVQGHLQAEKGGPDAP